MFVQRRKNILFSFLCSREIRIGKSGETRDIFAAHFMRECNLLDNKTPANVEPRTTSNFFPKNKMITASERFSGVRRAKGDGSGEGESEGEDEGENKTKLTYLKRLEISKCSAEQPFSLDPLAARRPPSAVRRLAHVRHRNFITRICYRWMHLGVAIRKVLQFCDRTHKVPQPKGSRRREWIARGRRCEKW